MVRDINGAGSNRVAPQPNETPRAPARADQEPATAAPSRAPADNVSLSSGAQTLKAAEEQLQQLPEVNAKRVEAIRAALASGQYQVDDLVVADKLLAVDGLF